jgi:hypothetical protein
MSLSRRCPCAQGQFLRARNRIPYVGHPIVRRTEIRQHHEYGLQWHASESTQMVAQGAGYAVFHFIKSAQHFWLKDAVRPYLVGTPRADSQLVREHSEEVRLIGV